MKKIFLIIMVILGLFYLNSCEKPENKICACGVKNPAKNLPWLAKFIEKAENDYFGVIWLENYNGQDFFVTNISLFGSFLYTIFDCEGEYVFFENSDNYYNFIYQLKKDIVIYVSPDYPLN
jgi:hypothetical protein